MKNKILVTILVVVIALITVSCDSLWRAANSTDVTFVLKREDLQQVTGGVQLTHSINFNGEIPIDYQNGDVLEVKISLHHAHNDNEIIASTEILTNDDDTKTFEFKNLNIVGKNVYAKAVLIEAGVVRIGFSAPKKMAVSDNYLNIRSWVNDEVEDETPVFIAVTGIKNVVTSAMVGEQLTLTGTIEPNTATNKAIVWTTTSANATITNGKLTATTAGEVVVIATIVNGKALGEDYTQNITITVTEPEPPFENYTTKTTTISMIAVDGTGEGTFNMGGASSSHPVKLSNFYLGSTEITEAQWEKVMGSWPETDPASGANYPARRISWYDAIRFCNVLSKNEGLEEVYYIGNEYNDTATDAVTDAGNTFANSNVKMNINKSGYRLPTEAEWEYAAGGAQQNPTTYAGTSNENSLEQYAVYLQSNPTTVKTKKPLSDVYELYDMSGNVKEWCWDRYGAYSTELQVNPTGAISGTNRISRGGNWSNTAEICSVAYRDNDGPQYRYASYGFRVARSVE